MGERVTICEVGPRDGLQMAKSRARHGGVARAGRPRTFRVAA